MGERGEILITIVIIFLGAILLFIFPMVAISQENDKEALAMVQSYTTELANQVVSKKTITQNDLDTFEQRLNATGNSYEYEIEAHISDPNYGKKTENQQTGDTQYYIMYTPQIKQYIAEKGSFELKQGDYIVIKVWNTNTPISEMFRTVIYGTSAGSNPEIFAQATALCQ